MSDRLANVLLSIGVIPVMVDAITVAGLFFDVASATLVNVGTPHAEQRIARFNAVQATHHMGSGCGGTKGVSVPHHQLNRFCLIDLRRLESQASRKTLVHEWRRCVKNRFLLTVELGETDRAEVRADSQEN